jgi:hypothetical protein
VLLSPLHKITLVLGLTLFSVVAFAKDKHKKPEPLPQDQIQVVAHINLPGDTIVRFIPTQHYRRDYLYAEHQSGRTVTLVDITNVDHPAVLAEMSDPSGSSDSIVSATGNAALVAANSQPVQAVSSHQTFRILNFADPLHPVVQQEFKNVTAMARDDKRGLIFLANFEGVWILQQQYALSPEDTKLQQEILHSIYDTP